MRCRWPGRNLQSGRVQDRDGHLWLHWQGARIGQYLMPLGGLEFAVRGECGTAEFEPTGARLTWRYGDGATEFVRTD